VQIRSTAKVSLAPLLGAALLLFLPPPAEAEEESMTGDVLFLAGGAWPQGSTTQFSDSGWDLNLRLAPHLPLKGVIPTMALSVTFFPSESGLVEDETDNFIVLAREESDRWAWALNLGVQLGSPTRRGFFRPRAGIAPGFYFLRKETSRTLPQDTVAYYNKSLWLGRLGWKGVIGADFAVSKVISVAAEFVYDQVWDVEGGRSARYQGFALGIAFSMESEAFESDDQPTPGP
jgi:hypothetical protein